MIKRVFKSRFVFAIFLLLILVLFAILGYKFISGLSWIDSIYMAIITISFVGFEELTMSSQSKIFVIILVISSAIILGYSIKIITEYIVSLYSEKIKGKKMQKIIDNFENHTIVCGYGKNGSQVVKKLAAYDKKFVIIEKNQDIIDKNNSDKSFVNGDAVLDDVLLQSGILKASSLICTLPTDADNLFIVLTAKQLNPHLKIISKASEETSYSKLKLAGADNVIMPNKIGGDHMASLVVVPGILEFVDNLSIVGKSEINLEEISTDKLFDTISKKTIKDLDLRKKTGCSIIGYKDPQGKYVINPDAELILEANSKIIVLGKSEQIQHLNSLYNI
ncbi:potassium channel protein [Flavobacteriaceae bacterium]|nr:potassium channel protein [Flavobacteriaceae bacterium]